MIERVFFRYLAARTDELGALAHKTVQELGWAQREVGCSADAPEGRGSESQCQAHAVYLWQLSEALREPGSWLSRGRMSAAGLQSDARSFLQA